MVINADEGEPGTAKDRELMNKTPHLLVEGCIITCFTFRAASATFTFAGEDTEPAKIFRRPLTRLTRKAFWARLLGSGFDCDIYVHMGAGSYECGEETALMSSLMVSAGRPAKAARRAPARHQRRLAVAHYCYNVETIATVVPIINVFGGAEYGKYGTGTKCRGRGRRSCGTKLVTLSGHVKRPGNYEIVLGTT